MGAILAILGEAGDPELTERLQRMFDRSPYRGNPEFLITGPLAIGIQSLGWDASLAEHGNWLVAFHGYIGNWDELAAERGWRFPDGASNATKIGAAFEDMGNRLFSRLRGEWAVLIWDRGVQSLLAARDIVGCRPLFIHKHQGAIYLATEIRQVLAGSGATASLNARAPADYLLMGFPENGRTFFDGVVMLPGGAARGLYAGQDRVDFEFWSPPAAKLSARNSEAFAEELRGLLDRAVRRATPEWGAGVALSGGLDSGSIWGTLAAQSNAADLRTGKFRSISNVYPGMPCDETAYIRSVFEFTGSDGVLVDCTEYYPRDFMTSFADGFDWPCLPNVFPMELVCEAASKQGQSVLLTGLGGDDWLHGSLEYVRELFYSGRMIRAILDLMRVRLPSSHRGFLRRIRWLSPELGLSRLVGGQQSLAESTQSLVAAEYWGADSPICGSWDQRLDAKSLSPSQRALVRNMDGLGSLFVLERCELQAARHGIEIRHPLMDTDIVEFSFATDPRVMVEGRCFKNLLRRAIIDRLPLTIIDRIECTEFSCLFEKDFEWLMREQPDYDWHLVRRGIMDGDEIDRHIAGPYNKISSIEIVLAWWADVFVRRRFPSSHNLS